MKTAIKSRSILFIDEMIRGIIKGIKLQTRRKMKYQPVASADGVIQYPPTKKWLAYANEEHFRRGVVLDACPFSVGMHLWVKEGVIKFGHERTGRNGQYFWPKLEGAFTEEVAKRWIDRDCQYTADMTHHDWDRITGEGAEPAGRLNKMFMPRWASRITLEITEVRAQRLQDISNEDALAEGITHSINYSWPERTTYRRLWESINGPKSWEANPWVWALTFRRIK